MKRWTILVSRENVDIPTVGAIVEILFKDLRHFAPDAGEIWFTLHRNKTFTQYIAFDIHEFGRRLYRQRLNSPKKIRHLYLRGQVLLRDARRAASSLHRRPSSTQLTNLLRVYRRQYDTVNQSYSILPWLGLESWQKDFFETLDRLITSRNLEPTRARIITALTTPWKETSFHQMAVALKQQPLRAVANRFQYLRSWSTVWYEPFNPSAFTTSAVRSRHHMSIRAALDLLEPNATEKRLLSNAPYATFFKDWRDDLRRRFAFIWSPLFDLIAVHLDVDRSDLGYLTLSELQSMVTSGHINRTIITERKQRGCIATAFPTGRVRIRSSRNAHYGRNMTMAERAAKGSVVRGIAAFHGRVTGRVIIVRSVADITRVRRGNVLVANTTHPNYILGMGRAAAFVTNEGGIISHAAIVAREMHKPCIVGTKHATKVLKDGDMVEVDATRGVVRRIR